MKGCTAVLILMLACMAGSYAGAYAEEDAVEAKANIRFIYAMCNDIKAMREFYTNLIGLNETNYRNDDEFQWLVYHCDGMEFMWFTAESKLSVPEGYAMQPGWGGGSLENISWSIEIPEDRYAETVEKLKAAGVEAYFEKPQWFQDSYWGFPVRDPMGNTVEIYRMVAKEDRPESTKWPD